VGPLGVITHCNYYFMKKLIDLLKSGNFTIYYHDNQACVIYKGKFKDEDSIPEGEKPVFEFDYNSQEGYCPGEVAALAKALGGKALSI